MESFGFTNRWKTIVHCNDLDPVMLLSKILESNTAIGTALHSSRPDDKFLLGFFFGFQSNHDQTNLLLDQLQRFS